MDTAEQLRTLTPEEVKSVYDVLVDSEVKMMIMQLDSVL